MSRYIPDLIEYAKDNDCDYKLAAGIIYKGQLLKCFVNNNFKHAEEKCFSVPPSVRQ